MVKGNSAESDLKQLRELFQKNDPRALRQAGILIDREIKNAGWDKD